MAIVALHTVGEEKASTSYIHTAPTKVPTNQTDIVLYCIVCSYMPTS
uniref:Uncharacterized protein n=1 Tax=Anguilla anguilla TaxID=7936 RepID=A0A0E9V0M7_ANGAN